MLFHKIFIWFDYLMHLPSPRLPGVSHLLIYWAQALLGPGPQQQDASYPRVRGTHSRTHFPASRVPISDFEAPTFRFLGYGFNFQVPASSIQAPISTLTSELLQFLTLAGSIWDDFWSIIATIINVFKVLNRQREPPKYIVLYAIS